jgi:hypothetical protein
MRSWPLLLVLAGLALAAPIAAPLAAQENDDTIDTDRPDFTDGTGIIPKGHCQVESGYTFSRVKDDEASSLGEVLVRIPLAERVEARLGVNSYDWLHGHGTKAQGLEDPSVGMKIRLTEDAGKLPPGHPEVALLFITTVPVGGKEVTADVWQPTAKLALGWQLTKRFSLSANADYSYLADGGRRFSQAAASLSAGVSLTDRLHAFVETFGLSKETADGSWTQYVDSGLSYTLTSNLKVDLRAGVGLNNASPNYFVGAGGGVRW